MTNKFINHTSYSRYEDIKRLHFIQQAIKKHCSSDAQILDIGCGNGHITYQLGMQGYTVTGIDVCPNTIQKAKANYHLPVINFKVIASEEISKDFHGKFDAIICSEVIEHLNDPLKVTQSFRHYLKKGGIVIVTVPNGKGPREVIITKQSQKLQAKQTMLSRAFHSVKKLMGYNGDTIQSSAENLSHVQFFTQRSLTSIANKSNFNIIDFKASNFIENVFPFSLITRKIPVLQKLDCQLADKLPLHWSSGFLTTWKYNQ